MIKNCLTCGVEFEAKRKDTNFCSQSCIDKGHLKTCIVCGKEFRGRRKRVYCSTECNQLDKENRQKRREETNIKKYGCKSPLQNKEVKEKANKTIKEKYGVDNISQLDSIKKKKEETFIKNYGTTQAMKNKEYRNEFNKKIKEKYGVENI